MQSESSTLPPVRKTSTEQARRWRLANPERWRFLIRLSRHRRRAAEGTFTQAQWDKLCAYYGNLCLACQASNQPLTVDHVVPISMGGTNWLSNIQPLCWPCNRRKHASIIDYRPPETRRVGITDETEEQKEQCSPLRGTMTSGEVEPVGEGEWLTLEDAGARLGIDRKAVYRRIRRGRMTGKKAPGASHLLVWFPSQEPRSPIEESPAEEEPRSPAVPDAERFALAIEASIGRALAPLNETIERQQARIEELIRENERLRLEGEHRSRWEQVRSWWREHFG